MKKYYEFGCGMQFKYESEKSIGIPLAGGYTTANDTIVYFPKSQIVFSEPNEFGNRLLYIPKWLFIQKNIDPYRLRDCNFHDEVSF